MSDAIPTASQGARAERVADAETLRALLRECWETQPYGAGWHSCGTVYTKFAGGEWRCVREPVTTCLAWRVRNALSAGTADGSASDAPTAPPTPKDAHRPLRFPEDRSALIERAIAADDSQCGTGTASPTGAAQGRADRGGLADEMAALRADLTVMRHALAWYPFGGLYGLLGELAQSIRGHGAECMNPETCGPLGCLLAKIHHAREAIHEAMTAGTERSSAPSSPETGAVTDGMAPQSGVPADRGTA